MNRPISLEQFAYYLQQTPGIGPAAMRATLKRIKEKQLPPDEILNLNEKDLREKLNLKPEVITSIRHPSDRTVSLWNSLTEKGVIIRIFGFDDYPTRLINVLGNTAPPILYLLGNEKLLESRAVGFCGSRKASVIGLDVAENCGEIFAERSINVVSGYAAGVDMATHVGALRRGGSTIFVLPTGILHFRLKEPISTLLGSSSSSNALVISEFPPGMPWKPHNAMTRNRTIVGFSDAMVVIESGLRGGTFEAGKTALSLGVPLFCVEYAIPPSSASGNTYFLSHGASPVRRSANGLPNISKILESIHGSSSRSPRKECQPPLAFS
jgi:DNA processing protein